MRVTAVINASMEDGSYPGRMLADLRGQPVLKHVVDHLRVVEEVGEIIVVPSYCDYRKMSGYCEEWDIGCFAQENGGDMLATYADLAKLNSADLLICAGGDCPLLTPEAVTRLLRGVQDDPRYKRSYDYAAYRMDGDDGTEALDTGYFAEVVSSGALFAANDRLLPLGETPDCGDRHEPTAFIRNRPNDFDCCWLAMPEWFRQGHSPKVRIRTEEDLDRVRMVLAEETYD